MKSHLESIEEGQGHYFPSANEILKSARKQSICSDQKNKIPIGLHNRKSIENYETGNFLSRSNSVQDSSFF